MKAIKIAIILFALVFFTRIALPADKIYCKKYTGTYKEFELTIMFAQNGKMLIEVNDKNYGGYFSTPGSYSIKNTRIDFFYRGLNRSIFIEKDQITASPYTFSIDEDYKTEIIMKEDKSYPATCK